MSKELTDYDLAELAYRAYGRTTGFKNYQGLPMPKYAELPPNIKTAWLNAAAEVRFSLEVDAGKHNG